MAFKFKRSKSSIYLGVTDNKVDMEDLKMNLLKDKVVEDL